MSSVDLEKLQALAEEADALTATGKWDRAAFERLWAATEEASGAQGDAFEMLIFKARPEWLSARHRKGEG